MISGEVERNAWSFSILTGEKVSCGLAKGSLPPMRLLVSTETSGQKSGGDIIIENNYFDLEIVYCTYLFIFCCMMLMKCQWQSNGFPPLSAN